MARAVLVSRGILRVILTVSAAVVLAVCTGTQASAAECSHSSEAGVPQSRQSEVREFLKRVESGPFFRELVHRLGKPEACESGVDEGGIRVSYTFHENGNLQARINSGLELSEQRIELRHIDTKTALALLKDAEKYLYGRDGCGIAWNHPTEESVDPRAGSHEVTFQGEVCNCKARVLYVHNAVVGLVLRSAC
jgi:hypothetical protein